MPSKLVEEASFVKINSEYARYSGPDNRILECSLCNKFIRNVFGWHQHVQSDIHKRRLEEKDGESVKIKDQSKHCGTKSVLSNVPPEGFFDDPVKDAKVRKVQYEDKISIELTKLKTELRPEVEKLEQLEVEEETTRAEQQLLAETTELMNRWSKIQHFHDMKDELSVIDLVSQKKNGDEDDSDVSELDIEDFLDWRKKKF